MAALALVKCHYSSCGVTSPVGRHCVAVVCLVCACVSACNGVVLVCVCGWSWCVCVCLCPRVSVVSRCVCMAVCREEVGVSGGLAQMRTSLAWCMRSQGRGILGP